MSNYRAFARCFLWLIFYACLAHAGNAYAETDPRFAFPVDCRLGESCWIVNYVDTDAEKNTHRDYACGTKTYDAHQGTDFALRSRAEMAAGVDVLAAADGTVERVRDGENDDPKTEAEYQEIRKLNKDCGNGVLVVHTPGVQSFYCHLKNDSIAVQPGDPVREGQVIAQIGQSGYAEFPHLHFAVIWENGYVDPFTGKAPGHGCQMGSNESALWKTPLPYQAFSVIDAGFAGAVPDFEAIKNGAKAPDTLPADTKALIYWTGFYHAQAGDTLTLTITDPQGQLFKSREIQFDQGRKRINYYYTGRKRADDAPLLPGIYKGTATFKRKGVPDFTRIDEIRIRE